jgi:UDPglucose 6-dehydrogenase
VGANVQEAARGIGLDNRIGSKFLPAGPGYGGSCFPKDTLALIRTANDHAVPLSIVESAVTANDKRKRAMARRVITALDGNVRGKTIAILGLTFKPNTDDMRDAPSIAVIQALQDAGARIRAYDPEGVEQARHVLTGIDYAPSALACLDGADAACIITEWDEFRALDLKDIARRLKSPVLVDLRNIFRPEEATAAGLAYSSIGR